MLLSATLALAPPGPAGAAPVTLGRGAWSWFAEPRALWHDGRLYAGWVDPVGHVVAASFDPPQRAPVEVARMAKVDDHDNPSLLMERDGRITLFYAHHAGGAIRYRTSALPGDVGSFGPEQHLPYLRRGRWGNTYPTPVRLSAEGDRLWLFWRGPDWSTVFSNRRPGGRWGRPRRLIRVPHERPYVKYASNGRDTIDMAFTRSHPLEEPTGIYYARYRRGSFYRASGRRFATLRRLPFKPRQADRVYDARRGRASAWIHDIALTRDRRPVIVYAVLFSARRHDYHYARWNGRAWVDHRMVAAGGSISGGRERYYSGGIALHPADPSIVYLSRPIAGVHQIERWRTPDGGRSWSQEPVTASSGEGSYRPVIPRGSPPGSRQVLWMTGAYGSYRAFGTSITGQLGP